MRKKRQQPNQVWGKDKAFNSQIAEIKLRALAND
jgi:hypothetical protein